MPSPIRPSLTLAILALITVIAACSWARDSAGGAEAKAVASAPPDAPAAAAELSSGPLPAHANPWLDSTREILIRSCGGCHEPDAPTANPKALAIFDLHEPVWHRHMDEHQLQALIGRVRGNSSIAAAEKAQVMAFVRCELEGECSAAG